MPQGLAKKASAKSAPKPTGVTKKYQSIKPSHKPKLIKAAKINKKFTSGLTGQTERMLGEKAGHLEMIGKGKKEKSTSGHGKKGGEKHVAPAQAKRKAGG
ncbi:hypothetical protein LTR66_016137 [Elasticomyces elasticus]|nr:hypothetical protein LTR66_016137 [Elasticomyces elasticus]